MSNASQDAQQSALEQRIKAFKGDTTGLSHGWDAVNEAMIRQWCEVMGYDNPIHSDSAYAAASCHGGITAPPAMMQVWTMAGFADRLPGKEAAGNSFRVLDALEKEGYPAIVAVSYEQQYVRLPRPGDRLCHTVTVEEISALKKTRLGSGFFIMLHSKHFDQQKRKVGSTRMGVFKYRPHPPPPAAAQEDAAAQENTAAQEQSESSGWPALLRPVINHDNAFFWDGLRRHELHIQRCQQCRQLRHPPGAMCPHCHSLRWDSVVACGRGEVYSFAVSHHPPPPPLPDSPHYPLASALIELEEGTRLVSWVVGIPAQEVHIGLAVELECRAVAPDCVLPLFRPRRD